MNHQNLKKDQVDIKSPCPKAKKEVSKKIADKAEHKQAIWDMYAYYGEPSESMFERYTKKNG